MVSHTVQFLLDSVSSVTGPVLDLLTSLGL